MAGHRRTFTGGSEPPTPAGSPPETAPDHGAAVPARDPDAVLRELYDAHGAALLAYLLRHTRGDRHRAEDILQETLLRAWQHLATLTTDIRTVRAWLYTVARNLAIDQIRAHRSRPMEIGEEAHLHHLHDLADDDDPVERMLNADTVRAALATLPDRFREIIIEVHIRDRPINEVAESLGIPPGTVKSRTYYAMRAMREALEDRGFVAPSAARDGSAHRPRDE